VRRAAPHFALAFDLGVEGLGAERAFGFDLREAQIGARFTRGYSVLKGKILAAAREG
jgi:hypothetical protein